MVLEWSFDLRFQANRTCKQGGCYYKIDNFQLRKLIWIMFAIFFGPLLLFFALIVQARGDWEILKQVQDDKVVAQDDKVEVRDDKRGEVYV